MRSLSKSTTDQLHRASGLGMRPHVQFAIRASVCVHDHIIHVANCCSDIHRCKHRPCSALRLDKGSRKKRLNRHSNHKKRLHFCLPSFCAGMLSISFLSRTIPSPGHREREGLRTVPRACACCPMRIDPLCTIIIRASLCPNFCLRSLFS